ncbi:MAG: LuxR C-terminal-related transcriptional regulator [Adlercreutzia sp.]|nr:LuxR C-terminal-related transcriptional regulator [Adlercreutzia sp.]
MEVAFYLYTIFILLLCAAAATISLAGYLVCRRRSFLFVMAFFLCYFFDLALIFQYEYLTPAHDFSPDLYFSIDMPLLKIALSAGALEALWLVICDELDLQKSAVRFVPALVYVAATALVVYAMSESALRQWLFYELRQGFLLAMALVAVWYYRHRADEVERLRLRRFRWLFVISVVLSLAVVVEDTLVIFFYDPTGALNASLAPLYLSERNFSENLLASVFAAFAIYQAGKMLQLRFNEPLEANTTRREQHIEDLLPAYCARRDLTARERDILVLILRGKDNQNIASELHVALGTVKAHTHNIMVKANCATRQDLIRDFWKE